MTAGRHILFSVIRSPLYRVGTAYSRNRSQHEVSRHVRRERSATGHVSQLFGFFRKVRTVNSRIIRNNLHDSNSSIRNLTPLFLFVKAFHTLARRRRDMEIDQC